MRFRLLLLLLVPIFLALTCSFSQAGVSGYTWEFKHDKVISALILLIGGFSLTAKAGGIYGDPVKAEPIVTKICASCHGQDGNSPLPDLPKLAGQVPKYLLLQLKAFQQGHRENKAMAPIVATLSEDDMVNLAAFFSGQKPSPGEVTKPELLATGKRIYMGQNATDDALSCADCHEVNGTGTDKYPRIAGQHVDYTLKQIKLLATHVRNAKVKAMQNAAERLTDQEAEAVAQYLASMK